ncbi:AMP-binding protein [Moorena producens JHB]|uniref:AMP-binding protein n=1 Tax=Moorena producens (strain JHB) TaxID=1454205 RepID=A0A1D9GBU4_MOOP1|nr:AMP-binding protein [Moorena producens]AOY84850.2 AMP-binding protein [Moorena producens JHB]
MIIDLKSKVQLSMTMLDMIKAFQVTDAKFGLFLKEDRAAQAKFLTYCQIYQKIAAYMEFFRAAGITAGTRILFPFEATEGVIIAFFALIGLGAIPLSVKPYGMGVVKESYLPFLTKVARQYRADFILEAPSIQPLEVSLQRLSLPNPDIQPQQRPNFAEITATDLAFVQFSSGSTSFPKGIPVTHGKIMAQVQGIANYAQNRPNDVTASWLPLYHDMGLVGAFLTTLYLRHNLHLSTPMNFLINPVGWLHELSEKQITIAVIPDFTISYCLRRLTITDPAKIANLNLEKLRLVFNGSEPINIDKLHEFLQVLGPYGLQPSAIKPCYGMAEAVLMVSCCSLEEFPRVLTLANGCKAISVGQPLSEFDVRLRTEHGHLCREGEMGEIELRGGTLVDGYFETNRQFYNSDGFFPTGDLGVISQGELFITGRLNDRFKINAQSYFASDFEYAVQLLPFVQPGKVCTIQADDRIIVLIEAKQVSVFKHGIEYHRQVSDVILKQIGVKLPGENILFIRPGQLEKTSSGKLRRKAISQAYLSGQIVVAAFN